VSCLNHVLTEYSLLTLFLSTRSQLNQINDEWKVNYIPGLRTSPVDEFQHGYRSRSAPPRRLISTSAADFHTFKVNYRQKFIFVMI
jgi:hypothetical protein